MQSTGSISYISFKKELDSNTPYDRSGAEKVVIRRVKGIPEVNGTEDTTKKFVDTVNAHFDEGHKLKVTDIARSHRLGRRKTTTTKPRPIIARFARETKKMDTFRVKKRLKGSGVSLAENLTAYRAELYRTACDVLNYKNVWTWEGRIFASHNNKKISIGSYDDIPGAEDSEPLFE